VCALGNSVGGAAARAYEAADHIKWRNCYRRNDIGHRAIARERDARND
jgi:phosphoribosylamine--glycine ligase